MKARPIVVSAGKAAISVTFPSSFPLGLIMSSFGNLIRASLLALGVAVLTFLVAPPQAQAAITITDTSAASPWAINNGNNPTTAFSGTETFTVTAAPGSSALVVQCTNYSTTLSASTSVSWITSSGTQKLLPAIVEQTTTSTYLDAEVLYYMNPTDGSGTLAVSGIGDGSEVNAFTISGVNTGVTPTGFGNQANASTVAVPFSSTAAGSMAVSMGGWRLGGTSPFSFTASSGPNPTTLWGPLAANAASASSIGAVGGYLANLSAGSLTLTQSANTTSRNDLAVAVFAALATGLNWSGATNSNWSLSGSDVNWTNTPGTASSSYSDGSSVIFSDSGANTNPINIVSGGVGVSPSSVNFINNVVPYSFTGGPIAGTASVVISGGGLVTFSNSNTYSGPTTITSGTLQLGNGGNLGSISTNSAITDNGTLVFSRSDTVTQGTNFSGGAISGNGGLTQAGGGALVLTAANTFTGATLLNSGTLDLQNQNALQNSTVNGGSGNLVLDASVSANAFTFGGLSGSSNLALVNSASNAVALSVGNNGQNSTYSGVLSGAGSLIKVGTGTQVIGAANTYGGTTTISGGVLQIGNGGNIAAISAGSAFIDNATLAFCASNALTEGTNFNGALITGSGGLTQAGGGTLTLNAAPSYTGPTSATNGLLVLQGVNSATGTLSATNNTVGGLTVLSIRSSTALGSGTANSSLPPISLNATGTLLSTSILQIGATIGTDPGGHNADFSYQVIAPGNGATGTNGAVPTNGQLSMGTLGNNDDGTGFAAYNANSLSTPRIVALYTPVPGSTTLATLREKDEWGLGTGDHITLGSPTANNTLILLNNIDLNGGPHRRWASIRGVGNTPEGELAGQVINSAGQSLNVAFDGNGGLIFDSAATSYLAGSLQVNGGAVFAAASDPAQPGQPGALGEGNATMQVGTSPTVNPDYAAGGSLVVTNSGANVAFMTYGPNAGIGSLGITTSRNINVGGPDVVYASATLGGMTDDWTQMDGNISLNEPPATPTTFTARNGGRCDFGGTISGTGSVVVGNSIVEGDATTPGIAVNNNGTIIFNGNNSYTGSTAVTAGKLYVNGSIQSSSLVTVGSGATLGGMGSVASPVNVSSGGILEGGQSGSGALTLSSSVTFNGPASVYFGGTLSAPVGSPALQITGAGMLNTNGNTVTINIASITSTGDYALIGYSGVNTSPSNTFTLGTLPNRATGALAFNNGANELDLDVTSVAAYILWTGSQSAAWNTSDFNWSFNGSPTQYIDNPGDAVLFDDSAAPRTAVIINGADVHPSSVTFNNNNTTYTVSGSNAIAGGTGLQLTGTGTVILMNSNTFTGATTIGAGATLQLGNGSPGNDGSISSSVGITDNGTLVYNLAGRNRTSAPLAAPGPCRYKAEC